MRFCNKNTLLVILLCFCLNGFSQGEFNNWYFGIYNTITFNYGAPQGQYSGPGVNTATGIFNPSEVGTGLKTISYGYTNVYTCSAIKSRTILVQPAPAFLCGTNLTDIRDNKVYATVLIGLQCWTASNLDFGFTI